MYMKLTEKLDKFIDKLDTKFLQFDQKLQHHETRLVVLEVHDKTDEKKDWKSDIIILLVKAVLIGGVAIASLAGAGGVISKIFT